MSRETGRGSDTAAPSGSVPAATGAACLLDRPGDPCTLVILGASGDLSTRKLLPSLHNLFVSGGLPEPFLLVGCSRAPWDDAEFRLRLQEAVRGAGREPSRWAEFADRVLYQQIDYDQEGSYRRLGARLDEAERERGLPGNRIYYLALPSFLYGSAAAHLGRTGLAAEGRAWRRIVVEKPFGSDRASAAALDRTLHEGFAEEQVFRIDHYLAKETVQNLLMFRFANSIFEPIWNHRFIQRVDILASETLGVERRAGYYERAGVLRDMFQNHMMQLLALTAMEPPDRFEAQAVQEEKVKVFGALRPFPLQNPDHNLVLGQYGPGQVEGRPVPGYRAEEGVDPESLTPTFATLRAHVDGWRWQGVPFVLTSGKRMAEKRTEIVIRFRAVHGSMFRDLLGEAVAPNTLTLGIQPREHITLSIQAKSPGTRICLRTVSMDFDYLEGYSGPALDSYEKALLDCMRGDRMLFWRQDAIDLTWAYMDPILRQCEACRQRELRLHPYPAGGGGPVEAERLRG